MTSFTRLSRDSSTGTSKRVCVMVAERFRVRFCLLIGCVVAEIYGYRSISASAPPLANLGNTFGTAGSRCRMFRKGLRYVGRQ